MPLRTVAVACFLCLVGGGAWAINKCVGEDGRISFQDAPCRGAGGAIEVRPASGFARPALVPASAASDAAPGAAAPAAGKKKLSFEEWDRKTYLENRGIREANADIENHNARCDAMRRKLANEKRSYRDNLTGAVLANSDAKEMEALATECASRLREHTNVRDRMEDELQRLREKERASK